MDLYRAAALRKVEGVRQEWSSLNRQEQDDFVWVFQKYHHPGGPYEELANRRKALDDEIRATCPELLVEIEADRERLDVSKPTQSLVYLGGDMHCVYKSTKDLLPACWINPGSEIPNFDKRDIPEPGSPDWLHILARSHAIIKEFENRLKDVTGVYEWLMAHEAAWPFIDAVDPASAVGYHDIVKSPMTISRLGDESYENHTDFLRVTKRIFDNCRLFYPADSVHVALANKLESDLLHELAKSPEFNDAVVSGHPGSRFKRGDRCCQHDTNT